MCIVCGPGLSSGAMGSGWSYAASGGGGDLSGHPGLSPSLAGMVTGTPQGAVAPVQFEIINSANATTAEVAQLTGVLTAAWNAWAAIIGTELAPRIRLNILDQTTSGRAQGGTFGVTPLADLGEGRRLNQPVFNEELRTGVNSNGTTSDFNISCDIDYLRDVLWFDTTLQTASDIPANRTDAFCIFVHEVGHALGFGGYGAASSVLSVWDYRTDYSGSVPYFSGPNVLAAYGGRLPLTAGNAGHYGNANGPGQELVATGLMNGVVWRNGYRFEISSLDVAVLEDIGIPTVRDAIYDQTWLTLVNGGAGIDTFQADYSARTVATTITLSAVSFTAPTTLPGGQPQTLTVVNIERLNVTLGSGNDVITGGAYADAIRAGAGTDTLRGGAGSDILDGGAGIDTAIYAGLSRGYSAISQTRVAGGREGGADTLTGIERIRFLDGTVSYETGTAVWIQDEATIAVARLYQVCLGRAPDIGGLEHYRNAVDQGYDLMHFTRAMIESPEFISRFGTLTNQQFVEQVYRFVLGREGDAGGVATYVAALGQGYTRADVVLVFSESPENKLRYQSIWESVVQRLEDGRYPAGAIIDALAKGDGRQVLPGTLDDGFLSLPDPKDDIIVVWDDALTPDAPDAFVADDAGLIPTLVWELNGTHTLLDPESGLAPRSDWSFG